MDELRIFVSSPGDVAEERALTARVLGRLSGEFSSRTRLQPIFWEHEPLLATSTFQDQIVSPSQVDIVVCIIWSRLGTRLPGQFRRADGSTYASGTEYEFEVAVEAHKANGRPELLVYRKTTHPVVNLEDEQNVRSRLDQKRALDGFIRNWFHNENDGTLVAAFHPFEHPVDFEEKLEIHLRKLIEAKLPPLRAGAETVPPSWTQGSPFRGLAAFEPEHAAVFCGRSKATSEVVAALREQARAGSAFVLVTGMSGGGKSSLLRAGVLPLLETPGVIEDVALVRRCLMRPGDGGSDPLIGLAEALLNSDALPEIAHAAEISEDDAAGLAAKLATNPNLAGMLVGEALLQAATAFERSQGLANTPRARLALVVDQLEEIFTHGQNPARRQAFISVLAGLARSGRVWVLATLRSDFYARLEEIPELIDLSRGHGTYQLPALVPAEITALIRQPAQAAGLAYEEDSAAGRLDDVLRDAAARDPRALPLLEFTLEELYHRRTDAGVMTHAAYQEIGGMEGAIARRAEEIFGRLDAEAQGAFDAAMHDLVGLDRAEGDPATRRWADQEKAGARPGAPAFLDAFLAARLLVADLRGTGSAARPAVTLAHEALLTSWPRLRQWLEENRTLLRSRSRVTAAAAQWVQEGRSADFLLVGGKPLDEARTLLAALRDRLSEVEIAFVEASAVRVDERDRELGDMRGRLDLMDVDAVRQPLANLFITGGIGGSVASVAVHLLLLRFPVNPPLVRIMGIWVVFVLLLGGMALVTLRKARIPKSLVSGQMMLTWGMIAVACLINGANNQLLGLAPNTLVCSSALFLAIGFATTAGVIQLRLLAASLFLIAGSLVMACWPGQAMLIFGGLWGVVFTGFGVWLRMGGGGGAFGEGHQTSNMQSP
ncbi:MAG: AAA family ATPase [Verrucomicrobiota bacterium]